MIEIPDTISSRSLLPPLLAPGHGRVKIKQTNNPASSSSSFFFLVKDPLF